MAFRPWLLAHLACVAMLVVLIWVWHRVQPPWWDTAADIAEMQDNQLTGRATRGPMSTFPPAPTLMKSRRMRTGSSSKAMADRESTSPNGRRNQRSFTASVSHPGKLVLKLFNYPAWKVEVNGRPVQTQNRRSHRTDDRSVDAGENQVRITFTRTPDRTMGGLISLGTGILLLGWLVYVRR